MNQRIDFIRPRRTPDQLADLVENAMNSLRAGVDQEVVLQRLACQCWNGAIDACQDMVMTTIRK